MDRQSARGRGGFGVQAGRSERPVPAKDEVAWTVLRIRSNGVMLLDREVHAPGVLPPAEGAETVGLWSARHPAGEAPQGPLARAARSVEPAANRWLEAWEAGREEEEETAAGEVCRAFEEAGEGSPMRFRKGSAEKDAPSGRKARAAPQRAADGEAGQVQRIRGQTLLIAACVILAVATAIRHYGDAAGQVAASSGEWLLMGPVAKAPECSRALARTLEEIAERSREEGSDGKATPQAWTKGATLLVVERKGRRRGAVDLETGRLWLAEGRGRGGLGAAGGGRAYWTTGGAGEACATGSQGG